MKYLPLRDETQATINRIDSLQEQHKRLVRLSDDHPTKFEDLAKCEIEWNGEVAKLPADALANIQRLGVEPTHEERVAAVVKEELGNIAEVRARAEVQEIIAAHVTTLDGDSDKTRLDLDGAEADLTAKLEELARGQAAMQFVLAQPAEITPPPTPTPADPEPETLGQRLLTWLKS